MLRSRARAFFFSTLTAQNITIHWSFHNIPLEFENVLFCDLAAADHRFTTMLRKCFEAGLFSKCNSKETLGENTTNPRPQGLQVYRSNYFGTFSCYPGASTFTYSFEFNMLEIVRKLPVRAPHVAYADVYFMTTATTHKHAEQGVIYRRLKGCSISVPRTRVYRTHTNT